MSFLGTVFAFYAMAEFEQLANVFAVVIGLAWNVAAFLLVAAGQATAPTVWGIAILAGLMGAGFHVVGFQHLRDIRKAKG